MLPPPLRVEKVVSERRRVVLCEAELAQARQDVVRSQERTGSGLNAC